MYYLNEKLMKGLEQDRMMEARAAKTYGLRPPPGPLRRLFAQAPQVRRELTPMPPRVVMVRRATV
jgi:hypothetical protein